MLAYLFPKAAPFFAAQAHEAGRSRLLAGVQYPSDVAAGLDLGRRVAALVIERARTDGSDAKWTGTAPVGKGLWKGVPVETMMSAIRFPWAMPAPRAAASRNSMPMRCSPSVADSPR